MTMLFFLKFDLWGWGQGWGWSQNCLYFDSKVCNFGHAFAKFYAVKTIYHQWLLHVYELDTPILDLKGKGNVFFKEMLTS